MRLDFCVACGRRFGLNHHHMIPRVLDGPDEESNLITLCAECHGLFHGIERCSNLSQLIREGHKKAKANGVKFGRKRKLSDYQRAEAIKRRGAARRWRRSPSHTASQSQ
jgi:hypothetical protein